MSRETALTAIPDGELLWARTVGGYEVPLRVALERRVTGCLVVQPVLLTEPPPRGVVTLADGVPVVAYETRRAVGGSAALAALAHDVPARVALYRHDGAALAPFDDPDTAPTACQITPDAPARELADDPELARDTRERAPSRESGDTAATTAFLEDDRRVAAIQAEARAAAREQAAEWGLDHLIDGADDA